MRAIVCSRLSSARSRFVAISSLFCSTSGSRVVMLGMMMLGGMIAFERNAKEKGVSLVARLLVVRYAHRHPGSASGHFPFLSVRDFLRQSRIVLLEASACRLPCGYLGVDICCFMPYFWKNPAKSLPTNYGPLSVTMD